MPLGLEHALGQYTFHEAQGFHRTIDHVFINPQAAAHWRAAPGGMIFIGGHGAERDEESLFDHRAVLVECQDGEMARLGPRRAWACRMRSAKDESAMCKQVGRFEVDWSVPADEELARLETWMADAAAGTRSKHAADPSQIKASPPDDVEVRLAYYRGIVRAIERTFEPAEAEAAKEAWLMEQFAGNNRQGLCRAKFLDDIRARELRRAARRGVGEINWRAIRLAMLHEARRAFTRLEPQAAAARKAERDLIRLGRLEPPDAKTMAQQLQAAQRATRAAWSPAVQARSV